MKPAWVIALLAYAFFAAVFEVLATLAAHQQDEDRIRRATSGLCHLAALAGFCAGASINGG